jgi:hypothetical protein
MNTAEDVKYVPGFAQPFINPPAGSKAGRAHRQNSISRTGVDPYMNSGFVPNFASNYLAKMDAGKVFDNTIAIAIGLKQAYLEDNDILDYNPFEFKDPQVKEKLGLNNKTFWGDAKLSEKPINLDSYISKIIRSNNATIKSTRSGNWYVKPTVEGGSVILPQTAGGLDKNVVHKTNKRNLIAKNKSIAGRLSDISDKDIISSNLFLDRTKVPLEKTYVAKGSNKKETAEKLALDYKSGGFIPNFAPPTSAIRIPWFKKFGNAAFDKIQPTLGISKASDVDTFRQIGFRSTAKGADENGDPNIFGPLYETFSRKALQLINKSNIFGEFVRGSVLQPRAKSSQTAFDDALLQDDGIIGLDFKGFPKKNLSGGSVAKHMNDKLKRVAQTDPEQAAKIKEGVMVFNETGHENQLPSEFGKNFLELAGTSYSQILKNSPDLVKGLSAETNSLLNDYVKDPAFLAMNAAKGFIPNFSDVTKFFRTQTGSKLFPERGTGLSGTVARIPGQKLSGSMLEEAWNNMIAAILGHNAFIADPSFLNPKIYGDVNKSAENQAKTAALKLSSGGKTASLGLEKGMMSEAFGNSRYVPDREAVFTGEISGKMKRVNYDRLYKVIGGFWSKNPETKPSWDFLKNYSESGKFVDKEEIKLRTSLLRKAYEDFLIKNNYVGTEMRLSPYRKRAEQVGEGVNYAALRSDLAGVSNVRNIDSKYGGFIPNFAYKQAVMGLEESMSGEKAVFDSKPFPHIRNKSQPTFSSAISDHGGLSNALSDSMRGQKHAGLMNRGYVPNFATVDPNAAFIGSGYGRLKDAEKQIFDNLNRELQRLTSDTSLTAAQMMALKDSIKRQAVSLYGSTQSNEIITNLSFCPILLKILVFIYLINLSKLTLNNLFLF